MATMKDIASKCNVSIASVSKALNGYSDIGEDTRNLIINTARDLGYLPNASARVLKTKRSYNLGVLLADESLNGLTHDYFNHVLESFKTTAESKGYDITFTASNISGHKMSYMDHCKYRGVDGVLVACVDFFSESVQELVRSELPLVTIDHMFEGKMSVVSDNAQGMEELVTYVIKCGHKKIAYLHGEDTLVTRNRLISFYRTMQRYGIDISDEYIKRSSYRNPDSAARATRELLDLPVPPTCILYSDDYAALGGINEIREHGLRVPEDISIAGFDGIDIAKVLEPRLTTICQDTRKIGELAANKLIEQIENPRTTLVDKFLVEGMLYKGASVKQI